MYENAWWDNTARAGRREFSRPRQRDALRRSGASGRGKPGKASSKAATGRRPKKTGPRATPALSSFRWNEVIFESFQSGNLKQLDLEFYLRSACDDQADVPVPR